jgi:hypothetical protein
MINKILEWLENDDNFNLALLIVLAYVIINIIIFL